MKKLLVIAALLGLAAPAHADYYVKDGNGALKLFKAGTLAGSVVLPYNSLTDASGLPFGTNSNPIAFKFGTGVTLPDFSSPQHFICDSGCGGGGGLSVPFAGPIGANGTPVGFKDAGGNLQPLLGDVTNGQWVSVRASVPLAVTGTFWQATQPVSAAALPLPALAATSTLQTSGAQKTQIVDGGGAVIGATGNALNVQIIGGAATGSTFGAAFPATGTAIGMTQGGNMVALSGTSGNLNVQCANCSGSGVSTADGAAFTAGSSLFAGAGGIYQTVATTSPMANGQQGLFQMTINRAQHINLRNATGTELGVAAAPLQVSLANTAANGTALLVTGTGGTFPVTGPLTDTQLRATAVPVSMTSTTITGTVAATQSGTWNIGSITTLPALPTGTNVIGRVGIDQTTPGTTNLVSIGTNGTVNPTTAANWGVNTLGSTTAGQSGQLGLGAVTTAAPAYSTAQTNALSLTTTGDLRTVFSNTTIGVTQATAGNLNATVVGTGTFAVQAAATLGAETTKVIGTVRNLGNAGAITDFAGQNAASPANAWLTGCQFNTSPTTISSGNASPCQVDNAGNLKVNIVAGASSGAVAQGSTTAGQTGGLTQAAVTTAAPSYSTAQTSPLSLTTTGNLRVTDSAATAFLSTIATASTGANPLNVNAVVTAQTGLTPGVAQTGTIIAGNVDLTSIAGTVLAVNSGNVSAGVQRNVLATNSPAIPTWGHGATGAAVPANAVYMGIIAGGNLTGWTGAVSQSGTWTAVPSAGTLNGATPVAIVAANSNNSTSLKGSAGTVYSVQTGNIHASLPYYLKLYDKATAPTCGTDVPVTILIIPPINSGNNVAVHVGKKFTLGIGYCIVAGIANNDNTAVPAATVVANFDYN